ncbi:TIGR03087 family PEP-CTERM/XrtA system glycosyltransferase [Hyphococcus sp.]|uniref:TIGR03087 family PEP-CTERM/XrtA system glycosyltransferase n=1 Tax=Hyphococcus sp. TaxID=2038636 RepID=UPI003CCC199B
MSRPEILFLSHRIPYPPDKGDKIRSWAWLKHLTSQYRVHLACFVDDPQDFAHEKFLSSVCETVALIPLRPRLARVKSLLALAGGAPMTFHYFDDQRMRRTISAVRERPLAFEFAFSSAMAPFIETHAAGRKRIVDFCDADSDKWSQYAASASFPLKLLYAREGRLLSKAETRIANWADAAFAISEDEAAILNSRLEGPRIICAVPNGVDTDYFHPDKFIHDDAPQNDIVFVGAMDYRANIAGVLNFIKAVWPHIRSAKPDATFAIVGSNPVSRIRALDGKNGVTVTGRVVDVRPWLTGAKVVAAPLAVARGVQNKVLEAMAIGKPVVASAAAMTGIDAPENAAVTVQHSPDMAQTILALLDDGKRRDAIGREGRKFVVDNFSWKAATDRLDDTLNNLRVHSSSSPAQPDASSPPISARR